MNKQSNIYRSSLYRPSPSPVAPERRSGKRLVVILLGVAIVACAVGWTVLHHPTPAVVAVKVSPKKAAVLPSKNPASAAHSVAQARCVTNTAGPVAIISISQRHLWVCDSTKALYDSAVITGQQNLAADLTPTGTYHIYAKATDVHLRGSDSTGSWDDPVSYWMPFLDNQYGTYGFHDATWRPDSEFGTIDPSSSLGSHGCIELPLATAKWLYNWASIGTTVTIEA